MFLTLDRKREPRSDARADSAVVFPTVMASEATTKNQPPDIDIIVFQIRPGAANGTSSRQNRSHGESRKCRATSSRSVGHGFSDW